MPVNNFVKTQTVTTYEYVNYDLDNTSVADHSAMDDITVTEVRNRGELMQVVVNVVWTTSKQPVGNGIVQVFTELWEYKCGDLNQWKGIMRFGQCFEALEWSVVCEEFCLQGTE
jgi:hypothetical protein